MCIPHATDDLGYPLDPELRSLQAYLGTLAGMWRHARRKNKYQRQHELVQAYHATLARLYELGWDDGLDIDAELPDRLMPEEYFRRAEQRKAKLREAWYAQQKPPEEI